MRKRESEKERERDSNEKVRKKERERERDRGRERHRDTDIYQEKKEKGGERCQRDLRRHKLYRAQVLGVVVILVFIARTLKLYQ